MSLLLDALKKAAEDKKKASKNSDGQTTIVDEKQKALEIFDDLTLEEIENDVANTDSNANFEKNDAVATEKEEFSSEALTSDVEPEPAAPVVAPENSFVNETRPTVSDDALSLLIYKTNSEEKKRKHIFVIGTTIASLFIIGLGGAYYYFNLQEEVNSMELKHRTAMMKMESKTNRQRPPEKIEIIDNLTTNSSGIKVEKKTAVIAVNENFSIQTPPPRGYGQLRLIEKNQLAARKAQSLLIEKTKQDDLVGKKLDAAWVAYEAANYAEAKNLYQKIILAEKNNRDALLGIAAIAVIEKKPLTAKKIYRNLLQLDPNDPLAIAALINLRSENASPNVNEKYLLSMLEKTPEVAQLNFELGNIYAQQSKWPAAQQSYFKAWQLESENADYMFNLAVSLDQLGQQKQAKNFYKDSLVKAKNKQVGFSRQTVEKRVSELSGL